MQSNLTVTHVSLYEGYHIQPLLKLSQVLVETVVTLETAVCVVVFDYHIEMLPPSSSCLL